MRPDTSRSWLFLGLTLVIISYFMVWLPHGAAGLSYIGLEMGEQAKFLPQVRSGEIAPGRSLFYLPPIAAAVVLILISSRWPGRRWQTWVVRLTALALSFLALPAFEAFGAETEEWLWRVLMIFLVFALVLLSPLLKKRTDREVGLFIVLTALAGGLLPTWAFLEVKAAYSSLYQAPVGVGVGVWLNGVGQLLIAVTAILFWRAET